MSLCNAKNEDYYDLKVLEKTRRKIDGLIDYVVHQNPQLSSYKVPSPTMSGMFNVTLALVKDFRCQVLSHIRHVLDNLSVYGNLYALAKMDHFNTFEIEYTHFPLLCNRHEVLSKIEEYAQTFFPKDGIDFQVTCLYMLYFLGLLVNPKLNWTIMDYLTQGNCNHQYLTF